MNKTLRVGIAGLGTVGKSVYQVIGNQANNQECYIKKRLETNVGNVDLVITAISARDKNKDRGIEVDPQITWHENAVDIARDNNVDVVVELIGGSEGVALELCKLALNNGKHVVTANKAMIAHHGLELAMIAEEKGVNLLFEAAVAGAIPIIKTLKESLVANKFSRVVAILNGTCNYILSEMEKTGGEFADILANAQEIGYAESDPTFDIDGIDAAHKLTIISAIIFASKPNFSGVKVRGIRDVDCRDINYARALGYKVRLAAISEKIIGKDGVEVVNNHIAPTLVDFEHELASVSGSGNKVIVESDLAVEMVLSGYGAGGDPTASAVIADIIDVARGYNSMTFGVGFGSLSDYQYINDDLEKRDYYVRLAIVDSDVLQSEVLQSKIISKLCKQLENYEMKIIDEDLGEEIKEGDVVLLVKSISREMFLKGLEVVKDSGIEVKAIFPIMN